MKYIILILLAIAFVPAIRRFLFEILVGNQIAKQQNAIMITMKKSVVKKVK
jgi:hypothetical protein